jgi:hypothetical protein
MAYGYSDPPPIWENAKQHAQRLFYEQQQEQQRRQQLMLQAASLGLNFQGDDFNNQFRLANMDNDILQQQLQNQRQVQSANLNVAQLGRQRAEESNREVTDPYQRSRKTFYGY